MLTFRIIILFWVTTRICLHALISFSHTVQCCRIVFPLCIKCRCLFKAPSPKFPVSANWSADTCLSHHWQQQLNNIRAALLNQVLHTKLAARHKLRKCLTLWRSVMSQRRLFKGGTTDEAFQEQCFLWERWASVGWTVTLLTSDIYYMHKNPYNTLKERETMKRCNRSPLKKNPEQSRGTIYFLVFL